MKIVVLTGAGISAESGIKTFRGSGGLWEGHDIMEVASPMGWDNNQELVLDFYNKRRAQLLEVNPNLAHLSLKKLEKKHEVVIITQNVDDLHERAQSSHIIHLHGELTKVRSTSRPNMVQNWQGNLNTGDLCENGSQLRPHIVWFGEAVPKLDEAIEEIVDADHCIVIGTSMQVYPAASLVNYLPEKAHIHYIDPFPSLNYELQANIERLTILTETAVIGVPKLIDKLLIG